MRTITIEDFTSYTAGASCDAWTITGGTFIEDSGNGLIENDPTKTASIYQEFSGDIIDGLSLSFTSLSGVSFFNVSAKIYINDVELWSETLVKNALTPVSLSFDAVNLESIKIEMFYNTGGYMTISPITANGFTAVLDTIHDYNPSPLILSQYKEVT